MLRQVKEGFKGQMDKIYRLSNDQHATYHSGVGSYVNFGGHGSGILKKKILLNKILLVCV